MENQDKKQQIVQKQSELGQQYIDSKLNFTTLQIMLYLCKKLIFFIPNKQFQNQFENQKVREEFQLIQIKRNTSNNFYVQHLSFSQQKIFFIKVQGLLLIWSILYYFVGGKLISERSIASESPHHYFFLLAIFSFLSVRLLISKKYRNNSIFAYFVSTGLYVATQYYFFLSINENFENYDKEWILLLLSVTQFFNFALSIIFIFYIIFEQKEISTIRFFLFTGIVTLLISIFWIKPFFFIICSIPYAILMINSFKKVSKGKFQVKENQVFQGALAVNFSIYFPFHK